MLGRSESGISAVYLPGQCHGDMSQRGGEMVRPIFPQPGLYGRVALIDLTGGVGARVEAKLRNVKVHL